MPPHTNNMGAIHHSNTSGVNTKAGYGQECGAEVKQRIIKAPSVPVGRIATLRRILRHQEPSASHVAKYE